MLKATRDIFADKDNKVVAEQSTVSGTFKVAAAGAGLSEQDAARYGITADKYTEYGLEPIPQAPLPGAGLGVTNAPPSQGVSLGAQPTSQPAQSPQPTSPKPVAPAPAVAPTAKATTTKTAAHTTAAAKPVSETGSSPSPATSSAVTSSPTPTEGSK